VTKLDVKALRHSGLEGKIVWSSVSFFVSLYCEGSFIIIYSARSKGNRAWNRLDFDTIKIGFNTAAANTQFVVDTGKSAGIGIF